MDSRVKVAVQDKIKETLLDIGEIIDIEKSLGDLSPRNQVDFAFGIAVGRIYNSFHYQTRRILKRDATEQEFQEFLKILSVSAEKIKETIQKQH